MCALLMVYLYLCPIAHMQVWDDLCSTEMDEEKRKNELYSENKGVEWDSTTADFQHHILATPVSIGFSVLNSRLW